MFSEFLMNLNPQWRYFSFPACHCSDNATSKTQRDPLLDVMAKHIFQERPMFIRKWGTAYRFLYIYIHMSLSKFARDKNYFICFNPLASVQFAERVSPHKIVICPFLCF